LTINGKSEVTTADVSASNGVVHIVDTVLIPPSQSCPVSQIPQDLQLEYAFEFQALDSDGDGYLNPAEFKNQGVKLADTFDKYSKSSAGQNWLQRLRGGRRLAASSLSTFWAWLQNRAKEQIDAKRAANVFAQFDKNNDKQMSLCEYENAMYTAKQQVMASQNIVQLAAATPSLSTLVTALKAGKLVTALEGKGPFTVFAPDNNAFAKLPAATLKHLLEPQNINELDAVLEYHVVSGAAVYSKDLKPTQNVKTLEGESLLIEVKNGN